MGSFLAGLGGAAKAVGKGIINKKKKQIKGRLGLNGNGKPKKMAPYGVATDMSQSPNGQ